MIMYNSDREKKRQHKLFSQTVQGVILSEEMRKKEEIRKRAVRERNADALIFFQKYLERELPEEAIILCKPVFEKWEKFQYRREATLAYHDVERIIPEHKGIIQRSVEALHEYMNT